MHCKCSSSQQGSSCDLATCGAAEVGMNGKDGYSVAACAECLTASDCRQIKQGACNGVCTFSTYDARFNRD